jgi:acetyltransferase-like isoleucine patch superfamily enzyme
MKLKTLAYSAYMVLSIMLSLTIAAIPAILLFGFVIENFDNYLNGLPFLGEFSLAATSFLSQWFPSWLLQYFWVIVLFVPLGLTCYAVFLGFLLGMFKLSRRGIPFLEDGYYDQESEAWLLYEYFEVYYIMFPYFAGFFSIFLDTKPRHQAFGAKIGKNTIVGNGRLFNPERTIIGDNCFFGYDAILSGHVYEADRLYLKTVKLGNNVTVGANAVILPGADIGDNVLVGANTVVPKDKVIPPNTIWVHGKALPRKVATKMEGLHQPIPGPRDLDEEDEADMPSNGQRI